MMNIFFNNQALIPDSNPDSCVADLHNLSRSHPLMELCWALLPVRKNPSSQGHCGTHERGSVKALWKE